MDPNKRFPLPKPVKVEVDIDEVPNLATEEATLPQLEAWNKEIIASLAECTSSRDVKNFLGILKKYSKFLKKDYTKCWDRVVFIKAIQKHVMGMADYFSAHTENVKYEFDYIFYITKIIGTYCTMELEVHRDALSQATTKCDFVITVTNRMLGLMFVSLRFTSGRVADVLLRIEYSRTNNFHSAVMTRLYHHCLLAMPLETSSYPGFYSYYLNFQDMQALTPKHLRAEQQKYLLQSFGKTQEEVKDDMILKKILETPSRSTVKAVEHIVFPRKRTTRAYFKYLQSTQSCHVPEDRNISDMMESVGIGSETDSCKSLNFPNTFNFTESLLSSSESESESERENIICEIDIDSDCEITYIKKQPPKRKERHKKKKREELKRPSFSTNEVIVLDSSDEEEVAPPPPPVSESVFGNGNYNQTSFKQIEDAFLTGDFNAPEFHHGLVTPPREKSILFDENGREEEERGIFANYNEKGLFESDRIPEMVSMDREIDSMEKNGEMEKDGEMMEEIEETRREIDEDNEVRGIEDGVLGMNFNEGEELMEEVVNEVEMNDEIAEEVNENLNENTDNVEMKEINEDITQKENQSDMRINGEITQESEPDMRIDESSQENENTNTQQENIQLETDQNDKQDYNHNQQNKSQENSFENQSKETIENVNDILTTEKIREIIHSEPKEINKHSLETTIQSNKLETTNNNISQNKTQPEINDDNISHLSIGVSEQTGDTISHLSVSMSENTGDDISQLSISISASCADDISHLSINLNEISSLGDDISHRSVSMNENPGDNISHLSENINENVTDNISHLSVSMNENPGDNISHLSQNTNESTNESVRDDISRISENHDDLNENINENADDVSHLSVHMNENHDDNHHLNENINEKVSDFNNLSTNINHDINLNENINDNQGDNISRLSMNTNDIVSDNISRSSINISENTDDVSHLSEYTDDNISRVNVNEMDESHTSMEPYTVTGGNDGNENHDNEKEASNESNDNEKEISNGNVTEKSNKSIKTSPRVLYTSTVEKFSQLEKTLKKTDLPESFQENEFHSVLSGPVENKRGNEQFFDENDLSPENLFPLAFVAPVKPSGAPKSNLKKVDESTPSTSKPHKKVIFSDQVSPEPGFDRLVQILEKPESPTPSPAFEKWQKRYTGEFKKVLKDINRAVDSGGFSQFHDTTLFPPQRCNTFVTKNGIKCFVHRTEVKVFWDTAVELHLMTPAELRKFNIRVPLEHNTRTTCLLKKYSFKKLCQQSEEATQQQSGVLWKTPSGLPLEQRTANGHKNRQNGAIHHQNRLNKNQGKLKRKPDESQTDNSGSSSDLPSKRRKPSKSRTKR